MATGGYYHLVGDAHGPSKASVCRAVRRVTAAINFHFGGIIAFPENVEVCREAQASFFDVARLPSVIGEQSECWFVS